MKLIEWIEKKSIITVNKGLLFIKYVNAISITFRNIILSSNNKWNGINKIHIAEWEWKQMNC